MLCGWPVAGTWNGQPLCNRHLQRRQEQAPIHEARIARLEAAKKAPLPDLAEALRILRWRGAEYGIDVPPDWTPSETSLAADDGKPFCGTCMGHRWLRSGGKVPEIIRCPACQDTYRLERQNHIAECAGLLQEQRAKTFATFRHVKGVEQAVAAAAAWAQQPDGWLVLSGAEGSGKTHLALAAANTLVNREQRFTWWHVGELMIEAKVLMDRNLNFQFLADLQRADVLFLDDLGAANPTAWALSDFLEPLLNHRYEARAPTLITCIDPAKLRAEFSSSIVRRMEDPNVSRIAHNAAPQWGK